MGDGSSMLITFEMVLIGVGSLVGMGIAGWFAWLWKDWCKVKERIEFLEKENTTTLSTDSVHKLIKQELDEVRGDVKGMADSMLSSVHSLDARLNELMITMINQRGS